MKITEYTFNDCEYDNNHESVDTGKVVYRNYLQWVRTIYAPLTPFAPFTPPDMVPARRFCRFRRFRRFRRAAVFFHA